MHMAADHLGTTFLALADAKRRAILARLISAETSVTELTKPFKITLPGISEHLKTLECAVCFDALLSCIETQGAGSGFPGNSTVH
jgi:DNA-binding transcriptional ArsR family regulator